MSKVIAVCNQKGGVAKTTTTQALAVELSNAGYKVLVIDGDHQANLTMVFTGKSDDDLELTLAQLIMAEIRKVPYETTDAILETSEGVDIIPSSTILADVDIELMNAMSRENVVKNIISQVKDNYDYILIDCPPSLGLITVNMLTAADSVLIPLKASVLSVVGMQQLFRTIGQVRDYTNKDLYVEGILFTMFPARTNISQSIVEKVEQTFGKKVYIYKAMIPNSIKVEEAYASNKTVTTYRPSSKLAQEYKKFAEEFMTRNGGK